MFHPQYKIHILYILISVFYHIIENIQLHSLILFVPIGNFCRTNRQIPAKLLQNELTDSSQTSTEQSHWFLPNFYTRNLLIPPKLLQNKLTDSSQKSTEQTYWFLPNFYRTNLLIPP